jgi:outer membrane protein
MIISFCWLSSSAIPTAHKWTLEKCVDYAIRHSPEVHIQELSVKSKNVDLNTERNSWLPQISASTSQQYTFGRSLTYENTYTDTNTGQTSISLTGKMNLFDGFCSRYKRRMAKDLVLVEEHNLADTKMTLIMNVVEAYLQVLMDMQLLEISKRQVAIDSLQTLRLQGLLKHGKISYVDVVQQRATLQNSIADATEKVNQLSTDKLNLCQLMDLETYDDFSIVKPKEEALLLMMPDNVESIFAEALNNYPTIQSQKASISSSEDKIKMCRSALYPQLALVGGVGTNYYRTNGLDNRSFGNQLKNNFCQEVQLQLTIPLFNRFETRNSIRQAQIEKDRNEVLLKKAEDDIYHKIAQIHARAMNAYAKITSYTAAVNSNKESFKLTMKKYECGKATLFEFDDSKVKLLEAESNRLQALLDYYYQCYLLKLYKNPREI